MLSIEKNETAKSYRMPLLRRICCVLGSLLILLTVGHVVAAEQPIAPPPPVEKEAGLSWPLSPEPKIVRPFEQPDSEYGPGHRGVDLAASPEQDVLVADGGIVVFAGTVAGRGVVSVDHPGGLRTSYEPVRATVVAGVHIGRGEVIGNVVPGHPECVVEVCLHWGVRRGEEYLDPLALLRSKSAIRLKPWSGATV